MSSTFEKKFQEKLGILNNNFVRFLQQSLQANPNADCTPTVKDYLKHVNELDKLYGERPASGQEPAPPPTLSTANTNNYAASSAAKANHTTLPAVSTTTASSFSLICSTPLRSTTTSAPSAAAPLLFGKSSPLKTPTELQLNKKDETTAVTIPSFSSSSLSKPVTSKPPKFGGDVIKSSSNAAPPTGFSISSVVTDVSAKPKFGGEVIKNGSASSQAVPTGFSFGESTQKKADTKNDSPTQTSIANKTEAPKSSVVSLKEVPVFPTAKTTSTFGGLSAPPTTTANSFGSFGEKNSTPTFETAWKHYQTNSTPLGSSGSFLASNASFSSATSKTAADTSAGASNRKRRNKDEDPWFSSQKKDNTDQDGEEELEDDQGKDKTQGSQEKLPKKDVPAASNPPFSFGGSNLFATASKPAATSTSNLSVPTFKAAPTSSLFSMSAKAPPTFSFGGAAKPPGSSLTFSSTAQKNSENAKEDDDDDEQEEPPKPESVDQAEKGAIVAVKCGVHNFTNGKYEKKGTAYASIKALEADGKPQDSKKQLIIRADNAVGTVWTNIVVNSNLKWQMNPDKRLKITYPEPSADGKTMGRATTLLLRFATENDRQQLIDQFTSSGSTNKP